MRILLAPDCFTGTLTAPEAARAMAEGWGRGAPHDVVVRLPLSDGGPGFLDTLHAALGGSLVPVTVRGPLGEPTPAVVLLVSGPGDGPEEGGTVAYVESAQAVGLHLVPAGRRDPTRTTSSGVGDLVAAALDLGATRIVVGLGGSSTNDGGAGMLAALGAGDASALGAGGGALSRVRAGDLSGLPSVRRRLAGTDLVAAVDVDVPLLGLHGASAGFAAQKGATPQQAQDLERALGHFAQVSGVVAAGDGLRRDLLTDPTGSHAVGTPGRVLSQLPGSGAAGGLGYSLALLGGRLIQGASVVAEAVDLDGHVSRADLVLTGEGALDWQSVHGKVVSAVAGIGLVHGVPVVVVAGQVLIGRREWGAAGLAGAYALAERADQVTAAMSDPRGTLASRVERVARTWSR